MMPRVVDGALMWVLMLLVLLVLVVASPSGDAPDL